MKKILIIINFICMFLIALPVFAKDQLKIEDIMTYSEYKAAGLNKQTPEEIKALNDWLNSFVGERPKSVVSSEITEDKIDKIIKKKSKRDRLKLIGSAKIPYEIQRVKGMRLKINNRDFEMVRTCDGFNEGDEVKLIRGNVHGICDEALFEHTGSGERCEVYCDNY